jgi:hypothetical protein
LNPNSSSQVFLTSIGGIHGHLPADIDEKMMKYLIIHGLRITVSPTFQKKKLSSKHQIGTAEEKHSIQNTSNVMKYREKSQ